MMGYPLSEGKLDQKTATSLLWKSYPLTVRVWEPLAETERGAGMVPNHRAE